MDDIRFCGQPLTPGQLRLVVDLAKRFGALSRNELAHTVCELLDWRRPNGRLKSIECRALLEQLHEGGLIRLPGLKAGRPKGAATAVASAPESGTIAEPLSQLQPIVLERVTTPESRELWRSLVAQHHYLGHRVPFGAHLRYLIRSQPRAQVLGCLQFSSPAWRMSARDQWIGWDDTTRAQHLQSIIANSRFLILPGVTVKNLASHVLSASLRTVAADWEQAYGIRPLLAETLVDPARYTGHCYLAANWIDVGYTSGRGRQDQYHQRHGASPKRVFLYPLLPDARQRLRNPP
ncbi:MAG: DUF4338 domain-containing protein [Betaproteobacteria bacterium]|nr:DUF4338 domain-containing protein [Betaproteobacteria bacterium]